MKVNFGGVEETVVTRDEFPLEKARETLKKEIVAVLGYGSQGPGQSLNLKDNGFNVVVYQREHYSKSGEKPTNWEKALKDGWIPGKTLFSSPTEATKRGTIISFLLSDASQPVIWPSIKDDVDGKTLYVSHGFPVHFSQHTRIFPSTNTDVIMVAPKGAGLSVRRNFLNGAGINSSFAVHQNASGHALEKVLAMGIGIGSGYLFETTCEREVVSDHVGERAVLLGIPWVLSEASYDKLRADGADPETAFKLSSEQLTQVILPLIGKGGAAEIYRQAISAGKLDTVLAYQRAVRESTLETMNGLYESCRSGEEARISLESNIRPGYRAGLNAELDAINGSEMWQTGVRVRKNTADRSYGMKIVNFALAGAILGAMETQYQTLLDNGHSPSEGGNETVEELTQSLDQFYQANGVAGKDGLLEVCSTTAQRGALDYGPRFKKVIAPVFNDGPSYANLTVMDGNSSVTRPNMWDVMETVRKLRPGK